MFEDSVIRRTGQWWKLVAGVVALIAGSTVPMVEASGISWTTGTVVAIVGYAFVLASISCPECGQRWFWRALLYSEIYGPLFKKPACPNCERVFD